MTEFSISKMSANIQPFVFMGERTYNCRQCTIDIAIETDLFISDEIQGPENAYLFTSVTNVDYGFPRHRMIDGWDYCGWDVICANCRAMLGWRYAQLPMPWFFPGVGGEEQRQGKVQLEMDMVIPPLEIDA